MLPDNLDLLKKSVAQREPIYDPAYQKEHLVITDCASELNELMRANRDIWDCVTAYQVNLEIGESDACDKVVDRLALCLQTKDINYSEFTSFWECADVSYSVYRRLKASEQREFLHRIIREYIARRHDLYKSHGYSFTTLQVKADSFAHKRTGEQGINKVEGMLAEHGVTRYESASGTGFAAATMKYILADKSDSQTFDKWIHECGMYFKWGANHSGKLPDYAIKTSEHTFVVEHKHMKEFGGGQDKQIAELLDFIRESESDLRIHYVSFLDGILFNRLFHPKAKAKVKMQQLGILAALKEFKANYFVNTYGFQELIVAATNQ